MKRHVVLLAEERSTIEGLLTRAVRDKINDGDEFRVARKEDDLWRELDETVTVLLLSSTFSSSSHNEFIETVLGKYPNLHIISLNNRFGDRSPLNYGAFDIVDKPVRNPVLWAKMDKAFESYETKSNQPLLSIKEIEDEEEISFEINTEEEDIAFELESETEDSKDSKESNELLHVKHSQTDVRATQDEEVVLPPIRNTYPIPKMYEEEKTNPKTEEIEIEKETEIVDENRLTPVVSTKDTPPVTNRNSALVIDDDEDDDEDDDLFGTVPSKQATSKKRTSLIEDEEDVVPLVSPIQPENKQIPVIIETEIPEKDVVEAPSVDSEVEYEANEENFTIDDEEEDETFEFSPPSHHEEELDLPPSKEETFESEEHSMEESTLELENESEVESAVQVELNTPSDVPIWKRLQLNKAKRILPPKPIVPMVEEVEEVENDLEHQGIESSPEALNQAVEEDIKPPSDTLEQEKEIFTETDRYDEKSEWIEANEGFVAKNGEFVSLAPPRNRLQKVENSGTSKGKKVDGSSGDNIGLFGSVKSLFKK